QPPEVVRGQVGRHHLTVETQGQWGVPEAVVDRERVEIVDRRKLHTAPGRVPEGPVLEVRVRVADDDHGDQAPDEIPIAGFTDDLEYRGCQPVIGGAGARAV